MSDPREVSPRCHQRLEPADRLGRVSYVCTFHDGHPGMHSGRSLNPNTGEISGAGEVIRWGSEGELIAEAATIVTTHDLATDVLARDALARAWDEGAWAGASYRVRPVLDYEANPYRAAGNKEDRSVKAPAEREAESP